MNRRGFGLLLGSAAAATAAAGNPQALLGSLPFAPKDVQARPIEAGLEADEESDFIRVPLLSARIHHPIEIDLEIPDTMAWWRYGPTNAYVKLKEIEAPSGPDPESDPLRFSGAELRFHDDGKYLNFCALMGNSHWLGYLPQESAAMFFLALSRDAGETHSVLLFEFYNRDRYPLSGARLIYAPGVEPALSLCFGSHCLGVVKGRPLAALLECAAYRCTHQTGD